MCGIAACLFSTDDSPGMRARVLALSRRQRHRGPDWRVAARARARAARAAPLRLLPRRPPCRAPRHALPPPLAGGYIRRGRTARRWRRRRGRAPRIRAVARALTPPARENPSRPKPPLRRATRPPPAPARPPLCGRGLWTRGRHSPPHRNAPPAHDSRHATHATHAPRSGLHQWENCFLAHERLAIIDPASGDQPLYNEDGSVVVAVNGARG